MFSKKFLSGAALTALSMSMGGVAHAQSTASQIQEEDVIVVTGARRDLEGVMNAEQAPRARATITEDYIATQAPGQSILNSVNLIPGVNFTNSDAYGASGGAINMRGFDGNRISLTVDGIPLNDTGNYAIYSSQQVDPELIQRANVNLGTTDVDSPTAAATGGTVNYITRIPEEEAGAMLSYSAGSFNFDRVFGMVESGDIGPWGTRLFGAASYTEYDQFVGPGGLEKTQYNAGLYQPLGDNGDFIRFSANYNESRNNFYYRLSQAQYAANPDQSYFETCNIQQGGPGRQNAATDGCSGSAGLGYYGFNINPSDTGNIRGQSRFSLGDAFTLTVDPSFQYVRANGGGTTTVSEAARQVVENSASIGVDFNGDGNFGVDLNNDGDFFDANEADVVRLFSPSNTNTYRYGVISSLIWDVNESNTVRFGYTWDEGHHRQTGEFGYLLPNGDPENVFSGDLGRSIFNGNGDIFQKRDRDSVATLNQLSVEWRGDFLEDALTVVVGLRAPQFDRELEQNCHAQKGNSSSTQYCTTQTPDTPGLADPNRGLLDGGFVWFDNDGNGTVQSGEVYAPPFRANVEYEDVLPNVGIAFRPAEGHQIFFSYAEGLSAPRTDDLYSGITVNQLPIIEPETTRAYDLGYRFQGSNFLISSTVWFNQFGNRIERSFDPNDPTVAVNRNVGDVDLWGAEFAAGFQATESLFLYGAAAWTDSEVKLTGTGVVDTPDLTVTARAEYELGPITIGGQARYVGERFANDTNAEVAPTYTTLDADLRFDIGEAFGRYDGTYLQLNVINLLDEDYLGQMSSGAGSQAALYNVGAPQTWMVTLRTEF